MTTPPFRMPEKELHRHDSIPLYTGSEDEGCVTCIRNKAIQDCHDAFTSFLGQGGWVRVPSEEELLTVIRNSSNEWWSRPFCSSDRIKFNEHITQSIRQYLIDECGIKEGEC